MRHLSGQPELCDTMQGEPLNLTWEDLILDNVTAGEATAWLSEWKWLLSGQLYPVFLSRFGNWFLRRPDGSTDLLDVHDGTIERIASSPEEFAAAVNTLEWQEHYLYSALVLQYRRQGVVARPRRHRVRTTPGAGAVN
jgi:hypothetical protein